MRFRTQLGSLLSLAAAASLVAGCSGGGGSQLPSSGQAPTSLVKQASPMSHLGISNAARPVALSNHVTASWSNDVSVTNRVFVGDTLNNDIAIFNYTTGKQTATIGGLSAPEGLATDKTANLYESDTGTQKIQIWASPYTGSPKVIQENGFYPVGIHVDAHNNIWVANICSGSGGACSGGGNTTEFKAGSTKPTVLKGGPYRAYFVTTNAAGDVWADGQDSSGSPTIGYWKGGTGSFKAVSISFAFPGGLQFDPAGNLLLDDQSGDPATGGSIINIYPPGSTTPSGSITVQTTGDDVITFQLGVGAARVFAPGYLGGVVNVVNYKTNTMTGTLTPSPSGQPDAVAVTPGTLP